MIESNEGSIPLLRAPPKGLELNGHFPKWDEPFVIGATTENRGYWTCFDNFFQYSFLYWGAVGLLLPGETVIETGEQKYRWAFWCCDQAIRGQLCDFIRLLDQPRATEQYLLLGQIAERQAQDKRYPVLLLGVECDPNPPYMISGDWNADILHFLPKAALHDQERFGSYKTAVQGTINAPESMCVCYVPGLVWTGADRTLVAGLIWCFRKNAFDEAHRTLRGLLDARAFSKQVLELHRFFPELGQAPFTPLVQLERCLNKALRDNWYVVRPGIYLEVPHDPSQTQRDEIVRRQLPESFKALPDAVLDLGMKALLLIDNPGRRKQYAIPDPFLQAMLRAADSSFTASFRPKEEALTGISLKGLFGREKKRAVEFALGVLGVLSSVREARSGEALVKSLAVQHLDLVELPAGGIRLDHLFSVEFRDCGLNLRDVAAAALDPGIDLGAGSGVTQALRRMVMDDNGGPRLCVFLDPSPCLGRATTTPPCAPDHRASLVIKRNELSFYFPCIVY